MHTVKGQRQREENRFKYTRREDEQDAGKTNQEGADNHFRRDKE